jgi:hypothetical protein
LRVYRQSKTGSELLSDASQVFAGDRLQLSYVSADAKYGMIFSEDSVGNVTIHLPAETTSSSVALKSGETILADAFELDSTLGFERFVLVTSSQSFEITPAIQQVRASMKSSGTKTLGPFRIFVLELRKARRR